MQKSRRLFFAFAAATALGATTLLTGCHHWAHRPPPPRGGRPGGGPGGPGGSGGPGRPGPGPGGRPAPLERGWEELPSAQQELVVRLGGSGGLAEFGQ